MTNGGVNGYPSTALDPRYLPRTPMALGRYYTAGGPASSGALTQNRCYFVPLMVPVTGLIDRIAVETQTGVGSAVVRVGLYSTSSGFPGSLILEAGSTIDASSSSTASTVTVNYPWSTPGVLWVAAAIQGAAANLTTISGASPWVGKGTPSVGGNAGAYYQDSVSGSLPSFAVVAGHEVAPRLSIRIS